MPRSGDVLPPKQTETPAGLRQMADRARRLAKNTLDAEARTKLTAFAQELETRAAALEVIEVKPPRTF